MADNTTVKSDAPGLHKRKYIGPEYKTALIVPGMPNPMDPKNMNDDEVKRMVEIFPPAIEWWEKN